MWLGSQNGQTKLKEWSLDHKNTLPHSLWPQASPPAAAITPTSSYGLSALSPIPFGPFLASPSLGTRLGDEDDVLP
jgi:hypothetical protein